MNANLILIFCLLTFTTSRVESQNLVELLSNSVGLVSFKDKVKNETINGTGTLMLKIITKKEVKVYLITNKHLIPNKGQSDTLFFKIRNPKFSVGTNRLIIPIFTSNGSYQDYVKFDPDENDLAAINVSGIFNYNQNLNSLFDFMLDERYLARRDSLSAMDIHIGDEIFFLGYPNLLFDERNYSPILRTGTISSSPIRDFYFSDMYRKKHFEHFGKIPKQLLQGFLIDANVFPGSSGSLVIHRRKNDNGKIETCVLGVLSDSYFDLAPPYERMQVGGVISADQILKTISLVK